jgi:predicted RNA binding protein YcfA (HicA-like mRNA interferase family)
MEDFKRKCKLIKKILNNPKNVRFKDVDKLLKAFGYEAKQPSKGSSHFVYRKKGANPITVPYKRPFVKEIYIKQIIKILELEEYYEEHCEERY